MVLILCGISWHIKYPESEHMKQISSSKQFWSSGNTPVTMATNNTSNLKVTLVLYSLHIIIPALWIGEFMLGSISVLPSTIAHFFPLTMLTFTLNFNNEKDSDSLFIALSNTTEVSKSHKTLYVTHYIAWIMSGLCLVGKGYFAFHQFSCFTYVRWCKHL